MTKDKLPHSFRVELYYSLARVFLSYANRREIYGSISRKFSTYTLEQIDLSVSDENLFSYFMELAEIVFTSHFEENTQYIGHVVEMLRNYIWNNLGGDLSINHLANITHYTTSHLSKLFKFTTGKNISEYIREIKLLKSKDMLLMSNEKINAIAKKLGFSTPAYFTRFFKKHTGYTPQEFRKKAI